MKHLLLLQLLILGIFARAQNPLITQITPNVGQVDTICQITGNNFSSVPSLNVVYFGTTRAVVLTAQTNQLTVKVPTGWGKVAVAVFVNGLKTISTINFRYVYKTPITLNNTTFTSSSTSHTYVETNEAINPTYRYDFNNDGMLDNLVLNTSPYLNEKAPITIDFKQNWPANSNASVYRESYKNYVLQDSKEALNLSKPYFEDVNGDGLLDILLVTSTLDFNQRSLQVYVNKCTPQTFSFEISSFPINLSPDKFIFTDVDGDGRTDLLTNEDPVIVYKNTSTQYSVKFEYLQTLTIGTYAKLLAHDNFSNNSKPAFITTNSNTGNINILTYNIVNNRIILNPPTTILSVSTQIEPLVVVDDLDGDLKNDLVTLSYPKKIHITRSTSTSNLSFAAPYLINVTATNVNRPSVLLNTKDINGDGLPEIIYQYDNLTLTDVYTNSAMAGRIDSSSFQKSISIAHPKPIVFEDINQDGIADVYLDVTFNNLYSSFSSLPAYLTAAHIDVFKPSTNSFLAGRRVRLYGKRANFSVTPALTYTAMLSDEFGNFNNGTVIGSSTDTALLFSIDVTIPFVFNLSSSYKIRISSNHPSNVASGLIENLYIANSVPVITGVSTGISGFAAKSTVTFSGNNLTPYNNTLYIGAKKAKIIKTDHGTLEAYIPEGSSNDKISFHTMGSGMYLKTRFNYLYPGTKKIDSTSFSPIDSAIRLGTNGFLDDIRFWDYNNDGRCDILTSFYGNYVIVNKNLKGSLLSNGFTTEVVNYNATNQPAEVADLDGKGTKEIITINNNKLLINNFTYPLGNGALGIATEDMDGDGVIDIITLNSSGNTFSVFKNQSIIDLDSFILQPKQDFNAGTISSSSKLLLADIDQDGKTDIIISNPGTSALLLIKNISSNGIIAFASPLIINTATGSKNPVLTDLNRDGKMDIVIADQLNVGSISIYLNNATAGVFSTSTFLPRIRFTSGYKPSFIAIADADGDGNEDIVTTFPSGVNSKIQFFKNNFSTGIFDSSSLSLVTMAVKRPYSKIYFADMNDDGKLDMLLVNQNEPFIDILINRLPSFEIVSNVSHLNSGDTLRIVFNSGFVFASGNVVSAYLSDSTGSFNSSTFLGSKSTTNTTDTLLVNIPNFTYGKSFRLRLSATFPNQLSSEYGNIEITKLPLLYAVSSLTGRVGDQIELIGDDLDKINQVTFGTVDAKVISKTNNQLLVQVPYGANFAPIQLHNGKSKIVTNRAFNTKYVGDTGQGPFRANSFIEKNIGMIGEDQGNSIAIIDIDRDGDQDIAQQQYYDKIYILKNNSDQAATRFERLFPLPGYYSYATNITTSDLDNDGYSDLVVGSRDSICFIKNTSSNGIIGFDNPVKIPSPFQMTQIRIADMNNDQKPDLIVTSINPSQIIVFLNVSSGNGIDSTSFSFIPRIPLTSAVSKIGVKDMNNDGFNDIVFTTGSNAVNCLLSNGFKSNLAFSLTVIPTTSNSHALTLDDINMDGKMDILVGKVNKEITIFKSKYNGGAFDSASFDTINLSVPDPVNQFIWVSEIRSADLDFDGKNDIVILTSGGTDGSLIKDHREMYVYKNRQEGTVFNASSFAAASDQIYMNNNDDNSMLEIADVNLDQRPDVLYADATNGITLRENTIPVLSKLVLKSAPGYACRGKSIYVSYTAANNIFKNGNVFKIELSDSSGNFSQTNLVIGTKAQTVSDSVLVNIPPNLADGKYKIRLVSTNPFLLGDTLLYLDLRYCPENISFYPEKGEPNSLVTITGTDLNPNVEGNSVYIGLAKAQVISASKSEIKIKVPANVSYDNLSLSCNNLSFKTKRFFTPTFRSSAVLDSTCISATPKKLGSSSTFGSNTKLADIDGDGIKELLSQSGGAFKYYYNPFIDSFSIYQTYPKTYLTGNILDLNGDGLLDMAYARANPVNTFYLDYAFTNNQSGYFNTPFIGYTNYHPISNSTVPNLSSCAGDLNRDGIAEIVAHQSNGPNLVIFKKNTAADYLYSKSTTINSPSFVPIYVTMVDIDGDTIPDLVTEKNVFKNTAPKGASTILPFLNSIYNFPVSIYTSPSVQNADLNDDGKADLIYSEASTNAVRILQNTSVPGNISFIQLADINRSGIVALKIADYNGDGKPDLVMANSTSIFIYKNTSSVNQVSFQSSPVRVDLTGQLTSAKLLDVFDADFDKKPDLIVRIDTTIYLLKNTTPTFIADFDNTNYCQGDSIDIRLTISNKTFQIGNQFNIQLSDSLGVFSLPQPIGSLTATYTNTIKGKLPPSLPPGKGYKVRVISTNPVDTSFTPLDNMVVYPELSMPIISSNNAKMAFCLNDSLTLQISAPNPTLTYQWKMNDSLIKDATKTNLVVKAGGQYALVASSKGCSVTSRDTNIKVHPLPTMALKASRSPYLCPGDSIILSLDSSKNIQYKWHLNNLPLPFDTLFNKVIKATGFYSVLVTDSNLCTAMTPSYAIVQVNKPNPSISVLNGTKICAGDSSILIGNLGQKLSYQWTFDGLNLSNDTLNKLIVKTSGRYSLKQTDSNNCYNTSADVDIIVNALPSATLTISKNTACAGDSVLLNANKGIKYIYTWKHNNVLLIKDSLFDKWILTTGRYSVTITDSNLCSSKSNDTLITFLAKPAAQITATKPTAFCEGDSTVLIAPIGPKLIYQWRFNGTPLPNDSLNKLSVKTGGSISLLVVDSNRCSNLSGNVVVNVFNLPATPIISRNGNQLVSSAAIRNQWYFNGQLLQGDTNNTYLPQLNGNYQVIASNQNQCFSDSSVAYLWTNSSVTNIINLSQALTIYPNPTLGKFTIHYKANQKHPMLMIYNSSGNQIEHITYSQAPYYEIDLTDQPAGVYILKVVDGQRIEFKKIIKIQ